jgi:hypothetical protein
MAAPLKTNHRGREWPRPTAIVTLFLIAIGTMKFVTSERPPEKG